MPITACVLKCGANHLKIPGCMPEHTLYGNLDWIWTDWTGFRLIGWIYTRQTWL